MATRVTRVIPNIVPEVELIGDWDKVKYALSNLDETIRIGVEKGQESTARKILAIVKRNIRENGGTIGWEPVSHKYGLWKTKKGYDPGNLLVLSGTYYRSITIWNARDRYYVGVKAGTKNPITKGGKNNITVGEIANILERGSRNKTSGRGSGIKPRPLWAPSFRQFGGTKRIKSLIIWHVRNEINNRLGVKAKVI